MQDLIEGLETLQAVKVDDYGTVFIFYSVTDEFMQENDLTYKDRVYQIKYEPSFTSYAVLGQGFFPSLFCFNQTLKSVKCCKKLQNMLTFLLIFGNI